jgi:hypothetical protein
MPRRFDVSTIQIDRLGAKLDAIGDQLTHDEHRLLLTVFGHAANALGNVKKSRADLPSLSTALQSAFRPTAAAHFKGTDTALPDLSVASGIHR